MPDKVHAHAPVDPDAAAHSLSAEQLEQDDPQRTSESQPFDEADPADGQERAVTAALTRMPPG